MAISKRTRFKVLKRDGFRCQYCGVSAQHAELQVDHIYPVSHAGDDGLDNLLTACQPCNSGKTDLTLGHQELKMRRLAGRRNQDLCPQQCSICTCSTIDWCLAVSVYDALEYNANHIEWRRVRAHDGLISISQHDLATFPTPIQWAFYCRPCYSHREESGEEMYYIEPENLLFAIVKINSLKDRVEGKADATILLDGYQWDHEMSEDQRKAVLDHEVMHLMLERDGEGQIVADDIGRPKLKMRLHDFHFGGFHAIAERHGPHSVEHAAVKSLGEVGWVQGVLQWG